MAPWSLLVSLLLFALQIDRGVALECKCSPSQACWPVDSEWAALNASVSGRLLHTSLPASVCYQSENNYDPELCDVIINEWETLAFHSNDPTSIHDPQWANNSCNPVYPNGTSTAGDPLAGSRGCTVGKYPRYVVNATELAHIQEAVKFAKRWNLRLNVKNTGHNIRSTAFGSLSIWTHHLKNVTHEANFQPSCGNIKSPWPAGVKAFTVGAGLQDDEVFQAAAKLNLTVVGGTNGDVGLVGWATGGGHGWLTSEFGMGADSIIQAVVVTSSGDALTVNECQNSDLFWAIRGGGGGTFGVITEVTVKAHPMPQATTWLISASWKGNCTSCWWDLVAQIHAQLPALKRGGFQGYYSIGGQPSFPTLTFYGMFFLYDKPNGTAEALVEPVLLMLDAASETVTYTSTISWAPSWITVWDSLPPQGDAAKGGWAVTSRLLSEQALTQDPARFARILELIGPNADGPKVGVSNPIVAGCMSASTSSVDNALNPAWRNTVVHLYVSASWNDALPYYDVHAVTDEMTNIKGAALRSIAPESGAYFNEADHLEPDWQRSFWGAHYDRLLAIKQTHDPDSLQWCRRCVGSESWTERLDGTLCKIA